MDAFDPVAFLRVYAILKIVFVKLFSVLMSFFHSQNALAKLVFVSLHWTQQSDHRP